MKHRQLFFSLPLILLLASCGGSASSSSGATSIPSSTAEPAPSTSSAATSEEVSYDTAALKEQYGSFNIVKESNAGSYSYDEATNTYILCPDTIKAEYTLSGYFEGRILISNVNNLASYKGVTLSLSNACLISSGNYPAIQYSLDSKNVEIKAKINTANKVIAVGEEVAIRSENHIEFSGKGELEMASFGTDAHVVRAKDEIRFYSSPTIHVTACAHDAFHGNKCIFSKDPDALSDTPFTGVVRVDQAVSQAFDFETSSGNGYVNVYSGTVYASNMESVFKTDTALVVGAEAKVIASNLSGDPYQQGDNSSGLSVIINGSFTVDGVEVE